MSLVSYFWSGTEPWKIESSFWWDFIIQNPFQLSSSFPMILGKRSMWTSYYEAPCVWRGFVCECVNVVRYVAESQWLLGLLYFVRNIFILRTEGLTSLKGDESLWLLSVWWRTTSVWVSCLVSLLLQPSLQCVSIVTSHPSDGWRSIMGRVRLCQHCLAVVFARVAFSHWLTKSGPDRLGQTKTLFHIFIFIWSDSLQNQFQNKIQRSWGDFQLKTQYIHFHLSSTLLMLFYLLAAGSKGAVLNEHEDGHEVPLHHHHLLVTISTITPPTLPLPPPRFDRLFSGQF